MKKKVVKFGGTSISNPRKIKDAITSIVNEVENGYKIICVVSAGGNITDKLLSNIKKINSDISIEDAMPLLSTGEMQSAYYFYFGLKDFKIKTKVIMPYENLFPIVIDNNGRLKHTITKKRFEKIHTLLKDFDVIIIPGFIALKGKRISTLGRNGSDITALIAGKYLNTNEVIIVTDTEGVHPVNPDIIKTDKIKFIGADKLATLSSTGATIIHPDALSYKGEKTKIKIIHHRHKNLSYQGTIVDGYVKRELITVEKTLCLITIYAKNIRPVLPSVLDIIGNKKGIYGITQGLNYIGFYVDRRKKKSFVKEIWDALKDCNISITERDGIKMVVLRKVSNIDHPGMIENIVKTLSKNKINIVEILSIGREIIIFVPETEAQEAVKSIEKI